MKLISSYSKQTLAIGQVVEMPDMGKCYWVKIKEIDYVKQVVHLRSADYWIDAWYAADDINAEFVPIMPVNSLAGGRPTEVARDMRGARAGIKTVTETRYPPAAWPFPVKQAELIRPDRFGLGPPILGTIHYNVCVTRPELDAITAGLRLLAYERPRMAEDDGILDILTNAGKHDGLTADQINALGDRLQGQ